MRKNASLEEWKKLYDLGLRFKTMKPWEEFGNLEIIAIRFAQDETGYFSIMGNEGDEPGAVLYRGEDGFNDFMGLIMSEQLGIDSEYMYFEQNCLEMTFGSKEDVLDEQYDIIKKLGLKFRGDGNWLYFDLHKKGYVLAQFGQEEVREYTRYLEALLDAIEYYHRKQITVDREQLEIYEYGQDSQGNWTGKSVPMPAYGYQYHEVEISDELECARLKKAAKNKIRKGQLGYVVEIDAFYLDEPIELPEYDRLVIPKAIVIVDHKKGIILHHCEYLPGEKQSGMLTNTLGEYIKKHGAPNKVLVANEIMEADVKFICELCGITLEIGSLKNVEDVKTTMSEMDDFTDGEPTEEELLQLREIVESLGIDMEEMKRKAQYMDEEEFLTHFEEQMMQGMSAMLDEDDDTDLWSEDEEDGFWEDMVVEKQLKNRSQKYSETEKFMNGNDSEYEDFGRIIEYENSKKSWKSLLKQGNKKELTDLAVQMGVVVEDNMSKSMLADAIVARYVLDNQQLKQCLSKKALLLWREALEESMNWDCEVDLEDFAYSVNELHELLKWGLIDVKIRFEEEDCILTVLPTDLS